MAGFVPSNIASFGRPTLPARNMAVNPSLSISVYDGEGNEIGFVTDVNYDATRRAERIRHLNAVDRGFTIEQAPYPEDYTVTLSGFGLYTMDDSTPGSLLRVAGEAGIGGNNLFYAICEQAEYFDLVVEETHPSSNSTAKKFTRLYLDNIVTSFSDPISAGNAMISQRVTIQPSWVDWEVE